MPVRSSHSTVSATAMAWPQFTHSRWVMIRTHTPASDRRHSASAAPGMASIVRKMRCSSTAARWNRSNSSGGTPHSWNSHDSCGPSEATSTPRSAATTDRNASV